MVGQHAPYPLAADAQILGDAPHRLAFVMTPHDLMP
jgi:hypothetical protein